MAGLMAVLLIVSTPDTAYEQGYGGGGEDEPPWVTTNPATDITHESATLNAHLDYMGTTYSVLVSFEWGEGQDPSDLTAETDSQPMTQIGDFSDSLTGLAPNTTYYFRAKAEGDGIGYGEILTFTTPPAPTPTPTPTATPPATPPGTFDPPEVITVDASDVTASSAILNGDLIDLGTAYLVNVYFQWEVYTYDENDIFWDNMTAWENALSPGSFNMFIGGLSPDTLYRFRAVARGDGYAYGEVKYFMTGAEFPGGIAPDVETTDVTDIDSTSARIHGIVNDPGTADSVNVYFEWGKDLSYGRQTAFQPLEDPYGAPFNDLLSGLEPGTTYHFRAVALGDGIGYGEDMSFTTAAPPPPIEVETLITEVKTITTDGGVLRGRLESLGTATSVEVAFEWGLDESYGNETESQTMTDLGQFQTELTGLDDGTTYHFRARAVGNNGETAYGSDVSFITDAKGGGLGITPWVIIGPILGAILVALIIYFFLGGSMGGWFVALWRRRKKRKEEEVEE